MADTLPLKGSKVDPCDPDIIEEKKAENKENNKKSSEKDYFPDFDIEVDMEDIPVFPIDGVMAQGNEEEVKLLFYYYKPEKDSGDGEIRRCKGLVEFRTTRTQFKTIMKLLHNEEQNSLEQKSWTNQDQNPMFS